METVKKNWPQIAVGVVAVAIGLYVIKRNADSGKLKAHVLADKVSLESWPQPRRIVDCDANQLTQQK